MGNSRNPKERVELAQINQSASRKENILKQRRKKEIRQYIPHGGFLLYSWDNKANPCDISYRREDLYVTTRRSIYIKYVVGPMNISDYRHPAETTIALTADEAAEWIRSHVPNSGLTDPDFLIKSFMSRVKLSTTMFPMTTYILDKAVSETGLPLAYLIEQLILERYGYGGERGLLSCNKASMKQVEEIRHWKLALSDSKTNHKKNIGGTEES